MERTCLEGAGWGRFRRLVGQSCTHHKLSLMVYGAVPYCLRFILISGGKYHITQVKVCIDTVYAWSWCRRLIGRSGSCWEEQGSDAFGLATDHCHYRALPKSTGGEHHPLHLYKWGADAGHHNKGQHRFGVSVGTKESSETRNGWESPPPGSCHQNLH